MTDLLPGVVEAPGSPLGETAEGPSGTTPAAPRSRLMRRRRAVVVVASAAVLLSVGGLAGAYLVKSPAEVAADAGPPQASVITAPVVSQRLARTVVLRGDFSSGTPLTVTPTSVAATQSLGGGVNPAGASMILTRKLVRVGDSVSAAQPLVEVSGRPVFVLPGKTPSYRDMLPGESGSDIAELQKALEKIGLYHGGDTPSYFGTATKQAVTGLYRRLGYPAPITGTETRQAVEQARKNLARLEKQPKPDSGQLATAQHALRTAEAADGPFVPASEMAFSPALPARVVALPTPTRSKVSGPVVSLATDGLKLTGYLGQSYQGLVKPHMRVEIASESLGLTAHGTVESVGALITPGDGAGNGPSAAGRKLANGGVPYLPVQIRRTGTWNGRFDGQNVRITITAAATATAVLTVPEAAVTAGADLSTSVTVRRTDGSEHTVRVKAGVTADGMVQVTPVRPGQLRAGDRVVIGQ
jgi:HlyD family secretion protein